jgi:SPP1 gp7 family putative phage head morphogenesis protein
MMPRKSRRGPIPRLPTAAERSYVRGVNAIVEESTRIINTYLTPELSDWPEVKADATSRRSLLRALSMAEVDLRRYLDGRDLQRLLSNVASRISRHSARDLERMIGERIQRGTSAVRAIRNRWISANTDYIKEMFLGRSRSSLIGGIRDRLQESLSDGRSVTVARSLLQERVSVARSRARLIATDQTLTLNSSMTRHRQMSSGIERYRWVTMRDDRVRESHQELDGTIQRWDDPPSEGHPGEPVNCRCRASPIYGD